MMVAHSRSVMSLPPSLASPPSVKYSTYTEASKCRDRFHSVSDDALLKKIRHSPTQLITAPFIAMHLPYSA